MNNDLRTNLIRLAAEHPNLRPHVLSILAGQKRMLVTTAVKGSVTFSHKGFIQTVSPRVSWPGTTGSFQLTGPFMISFDNVGYLIKCSVQVDMVKDEFRTGGIYLDFEDRTSEYFFRALLEQHIMLAFDKYRDALGTGA